MCGRFLIGGDFRDKLNELIASEGIIPSDLPYHETGQDVFPSEPSLIIHSGGQDLLAGEMLWGFRTDAYGLRIITMVLHPQISDEFFERDYTIYD
jgi:hypothetical protein